MRETLKTLARALALVAVVPALVSYYIRAAIIGRNRALEGSTQMLALLPGIVGQYLRRAFLSRTLAACHHTVTVCFGTVFSQAGARLDEYVYVGVGCHLGLVHIERDALLASGVHVPSGRQTHGTSDPDIPIREQEGTRSMVRIGASAWIGSAAIVMADIGRHSVIGAGSVVTRAIPDGVVAAGVPARVVRRRDEVPSSYSV